MWKVRRIQKGTQELRSLNVDCTLMSHSRRISWKTKTWFYFLLESFSAVPPADVTGWHALPSQVENVHVEMPVPSIQRTSGSLSGFNYHLGMFSRLVAKSYEFLRTQIVAFIFMCYTIPTMEFRVCTLLHWNHTHPYYIRITAHAEDLRLVIYSQGGKEVGSGHAACLIYTVCSCNGTGSIMMAPPAWLSHCIIHTKYIFRSFSWISKCLWFLFLS